MSAALVRCNLLSDKSRSHSLVFFVVQPQNSPELVEREKRSRERHESEIYEHYYYTTALETFRYCLISRCDSHTFKYIKMRNIYNFYVAPNNDICCVSKARSTHRYNIKWSIIKNILCILYFNMLEPHSVV